MDPLIHEYDVIICGGGPAGSAAALSFSDSGLRVAVIEKNTFPREKVCGDAMSSYIPKALGAISPKFRTAFENFDHKLHVSHIFLSSYNGKTGTLKIPEKFFISPRYNFDNFLYEQAKAFTNIKYFLQRQIKKVSLNEEKCSVTTNLNEIFYAKIILGCDGAISTVRKELTNYKMAPQDNYAGVRAYYENVGDENPDRFELYFSSKYPEGYFWLFPSFNKKVNIGFIMFSDKVSKGKIALKNAMLDIIECTPSLKERFKEAKLVEDIKGWSIPLGYNSYPISGMRFILCGDAASLADPFTGEGIGPAIVSARLAAKQVMKCFEKNDFSKQFMHGYDKDIYSKYGKMYKKRRILVNITTTNNWLMNIFFIFLKSSFIKKMAFKLYIRLVS